MSFAILIILLPLGLAASLIFRGLRGFRVGTHPVCRRCGYDLFGQPVGTVICGECGSSLTAPNSVYIGHHQRRPSLIVAGIVILVPVLFVAGVMVWGQINDIHWMSYAPTRFVIWRAESANPATRSPALAELNARLTAGKLSTAELEKIADAGLAYQADLTKPWDTGWGDLLEAIQSRGKLSDDRWKRYLTQASQGAFGLRLRKQVRHGDGLPWQIERIANRAGTKMKLQISFESSPLEWLSPHGPVPKTQLPIACQTSLYGSGGASLAKLQPAQFPEPLPDGVQQVHVHGTVKVGFRGNTWRINPMVSSEIDLPGTFTLLPASTPITTDPQEALHTEQVRKSLSVEVAFYSRPSPGLNVTVTQHSVPIMIDVNVLVRTNGREVLIGGFGYPAQPPGSMPSGTVMEPPWPAGNPGTVDIILRSNPDFIMPDPWNAGEIWTGEIIFKDVPVK